MGVGVGVREVERQQFDSSRRLPHDILSRVMSLRPSTFGLRFHELQMNTYPYFTNIGDFGTVTFGRPE